MAERSEGLPDLTPRHYDQATVDLWDDTGWSQVAFPDSKPTRKPNGEPLEEANPDVVMGDPSPADPKALGATAKRALDWM